MYTPDDTRKMVFSLREIMHYHTKKIPAYKSASGATQDEPGELIRITVNPMESVISHIATTDTYEVNTLGHTLSKWREIRYLGTRLEAVPLATTGKIDPEDITQSASGVPRGSGTEYSPQGSVHPYDAINFVSYRRWTGGNISVAAWNGSNISSDTNYINECLKYDQLWLSDGRFNHVKLTDGFKFDAVPLRVDLETAALAGNSLFGFSTAGSFFPDINPNNTLTTSTGATPTSVPIGTGATQTPWRNSNLDQYFQPQGMIMPQAGNQYHEEGWLPNPLAGFKYTTSASQYTPGDERYTINGFFKNFPWFADRIDLSEKTFTQTSGSQTYTERLQTFDLNYLVKLVLERFINPIALIRFPSAYGTMFFWNIFMEHIMEVRKPFLVNSEWKAGKAEVITNNMTPLSQFTNDKEFEEFRTPYKQIESISCLSPDPYGLCEEPSTVTLDDLTPALGYHIRTEPRFTTAEDEEEPEPEDHEDPDPTESIPHN